MSVGPGTAGASIYHGRIGEMRLFRENTTALPIAANNPNLQ